MKFNFFQKFTENFSLYAASFILFLTQLGVWCSNAPVSTVIVNCVPLSIRSRTVGLSILLIHLLGDASSPFIIGAISDSTGSIVLAVIIIPVALAISGFIWTVGWRVLPEVVEKIKPGEENDRGSLIE